MIDRVAKKRVPKGIASKGKTVHRSRAAIVQNRRLLRVKNKSCDEDEIGVSLENRRIIIKDSA